LKESRKEGLEDVDLDVQKEATKGGQGTIRTTKNQLALDPLLGQNHKYPNLPAY